MTIMMHQHGHQAHSTSGVALGPAGLVVSWGGYTLEPFTAVFEPGHTAHLRFRIRDRDGAAVTSFDAQHEELLHLMVVRRDFAHFQHLHPSLGADGTWSVPLTLPEAGFYRAFADFAVGGASYTLGADLAAPGELRLAPPLAVSTRARSEPYQVELATSAPDPGGSRVLAFTGRRHQDPVLDLEPYLGALGHLVALREGDLAYVHVHPLAAGPSRPAIEFHVGFPSGGRYRLFLQFAHQGRVHTVEYALEV
jgi:hypothetical protein